MLFVVSAIVGSTDLDDAVGSADVDDEKATADSWCICCCATVVDVVCEVPVVSVLDRIISDLGRITVVGMLSQASKIDESVDVGSEKIWDLKLNTIFEFNFYWGAIGNGNSKFSEKIIINSWWLWFKTHR